MIEQLATARRDRAHVEGVLSDLELELGTIESSRAGRFRQQSTTSSLGKTQSLAKTWRRPECPRQQLLVLSNSILGQWSPKRPSRLPS